MGPSEPFGRLRQVRADGGSVGNVAQVHETNFSGEILDGISSTAAVMYGTACQENYPKRVRYYMQLDGRYPRRPHRLWPAPRSARPGSAQPEEVSRL
jgi:hypothetical protein